MKKFLAVAILCLANQMGISQMELSIFEPNPYALTPYSLINGTVQYDGDPIQVKIIAEITELTTSASLLKVEGVGQELKSGIFTLGQLISKLNSSYGRSKAAQSLQAKHILDSGRYSLCVQVVTVGGVEPPLALECIFLEVESNRILQLVYPMDGDTILETKPNFNWIYTNSNRTDDNLIIILAEVVNNQSSDQAILENKTLYTQRGLQRNSLNYPTSASPLKPGHTYAWVVQEWSGSQLLQTSEYWKFHIKREIFREPEKYVRLTADNDAALYHVVDGSIYFTLDDRYAKFGLTIIVHDKNGKEIKPVLSSDIAESALVASGAQFQQFQLNLKNYQLERDTYEIILINSSGTQYRLKFSYE
ncbi:MAG: hypothetical protein RL092_671 [Bacteroidota bacterium]|jgi:hypothetical protein